jgi:hypothetical protein
LHLNPLTRFAVLSGVCAVRKAEWLPAVTGALILWRSFASN